jgi:hypothetical protein
MASYCLALAQKEMVEKRYWSPTFDLTMLAARRAIERLVGECEERAHLVEGDAFTDGHFFRYRVTILIGLMSAWALQERKLGRESPNVDFVENFLLRNLRASTPWGESAIPYYVLAALLLEQLGKQGMSEGLVSNLISTISIQNADDATRPGFPNVHYGPEAAVKLANGLDPNNLENFVGFSYMLLPLIDFLARRLRRHELAALWHRVTRISLQEFEPQYPWQSLTWRSNAGMLKSSFAHEPQSWKNLAREAEMCDTSHVPDILKKNPSFLPFFILVFPHRYDRSIQGLLDGWLLGRGVPS